MITLEGIQLPSSMRWLERFTVQSVAQLRKRTLGGKQVISVASLTAGTNITLEGTTEYGWVTKTTAEQIIALSEGIGLVYTLTFAGGSYAVVFRHDDPPAVRFEPLIPREAQASGDWLAGTIKLVTV